MYSVFKPPLGEIEFQLLMKKVNLEIIILHGNIDIRALKPGAFLGQKLGGGKTLNQNALFLYNLLKGGKSTLDFHLSNAN